MEQGHLKTQMSLHHHTQHHNPQPHIECCSRSQQISCQHHAGTQTSLWEFLFLLADDSTAGSLQGSADQNEVPKHGSHVPVPQQLRARPGPEAMLLQLVHER